MRKTALALLISFLLGISGALAQDTGARSDGIKTLSFVGFDSSDLEESGRAILAELVRREIAHAPGFTLLERKDLGTIIEEQEIRLSALFEGAGALRIGELLGADYIMVGRIGKLGTLYIISLRMLDVATGDRKSVV